MHELASVKQVFTYGSLMFAPVWLSVCSQTYPTLQATLFGFKRYCVQGEAYPALVPGEGAQVSGLIYKNVSAADCLNLDRFEGSEYLLRSATAVTAEGPLEVVFYEFVALDQLIKQDWSVAEFELNGLPSFLSRQVSQFKATGARQPQRR
jgi:gamma-glutamylcyclotransferase (GGCT)/AIG2-like uncharacterized protein YtfP